MTRRDSSTRTLVCTLDARSIRRRRIRRSTYDCSPVHSVTSDDPMRLPAVWRAARIADYLDRETARIDTLIEEQQRLIEMLRERRLRLRIARRSAWDNAQPKTIESPLPWALMLPAHWRIVPLTSVADLESGHTPSRSRERLVDGLLHPWVSLHDVGTMRGTTVRSRHGDSHQRRRHCQQFCPSAPGRTVVLSRRRYRWTHRDHGHTDGHVSALRGLGLRPAS